MIEINSAEQLEQLLSTQKELFFSTSGISMFPMLRNRKDVVVIAPPPPQLKKWDVPLYPRSDELVLHRILAVKSDHYVIRGDNLLDKERIPKEQIVGILKAFYRNGKYYDCQKSLSYKVYIRLNYITFPLRYFWRRGLLPLLVKIKHMVIPPHHA